MRFNNLPTDIVDKIFLDGRDDLKTAVDCTPIYSYPMLLTCVCKEWKSVAISCVPLWSTICVQITGVDSLRPPLPMIETWIQRSGSVPLSFSLCVARIIGYRTPSTALFSQILRTVFLPHHLRWQKIVLGINDEAVTDDVVESLERDYPMLQSFKIESTCGPQLLRALLHAPTPRAAVDVNLKGWPSDNLTARILSTQEPTTPWRVLRSLRFGSVDWTPYATFQLLSKYCPNLQNFSVWSAVRARFATPHPPPGVPASVRHSNLRALYITFARAYGLNCPCPVLKVLDGLTLPSLTELGITYVRPFEGQVAMVDSTLRAFIERSGCTLVRFVLEGDLLDLSRSYLKLKLINAWLGALPPSVESLRLSPVCTETELQEHDLEDVLEALCKLRSTLPLLRELTLADWDARFRQGFTVPIHKITPNERIAFRCLVEAYLHHSSLKTLILPFEDDQDQTLLKELQGLVQDAGGDLRVSMGGNRDEDMFAWW